MQAVKLIRRSLLVLTSVIVSCAKADAATMNRLVYLSQNTIYVLGSASSMVDLVEIDRWRLRRGKVGESYAGLSCGGRGEVITHASYIAISESSNARSIVSEVLSGDWDTKQLTTLVESSGSTLLFPVLSPNGLIIAALEQKGHTTALVLINRPDLQRKAYPFANLGSPNAWSSNGQHVYLTALGTRGEARSVRFDLHTSRFEDIGSGHTPTPSPSGILLAVLSEDRSQLRIRNLKTGAMSTVHGFFRAIVSWVDEGTVITINSRGPYQDSIAMTSIGSGRSTEIALSFAEIDGACASFR
jgi:hypothetical protein